MFNRCLRISVRSAVVPKTDFFVDYFNRPLGRNTLALATISNINTINISTHFKSLILTKLTKVLLKAFCITFMY